MTPRDSKHLAEFLPIRAVLGMHVTNRLDELVCVFRQIGMFSMLPGQSGFSCVIVILLKRYPFKVLWTVVVFVAVQMVDRLVHGCVIRNSVKRLGNESMGKNFSLAEGNHYIPVAINSSTDDTPLEFPSSSVFVDQRSRQATYTPEAGSFKKSVERINRLPNFCGGHFRYSGVLGLPNYTS